ncbi:MAG: GNAT family N-acetyltransferase [Clostridia bacterium]
MDTKIPGFTIRFAHESDTSTIFGFIKELAAYEKLPDDVSGTQEILHESLFVRHAAEVIVGEYEGEPVAFALFFYNFSTFQCLPGLYLEDLFVRESYRSRGIGKAMLAFLANTATQRGCGRFEWICLDWNKDAIAVYRKIGAIPMQGWTIQRLEGEALAALSREA